MSPFSSILVPIDFGETSNLALDVALALAERFGASVTLVHVSWRPPDFGFGAGIRWPHEEVSEAAKKDFDAAISDARRRYARVDGVHVEGEAWEMILQTAKERASDLIVMGTHGRRGLSRVLMGSVAEKIVRLSPVPVLTVPGKAERSANEGNSPA